MIQPIDDLIEHLKGQTPYGKTEALKLWEALKILSDGILTKGSIQASQLAPGSITFDSGALGGDISNLLTKYSNLWSTNIVFSATNNNTVQWTAGTIKFVDGTQATISAGNTGVMSSLTYIIYHPDFSNTTFQISTNYSDAVGPADRILMCIANNVTDATQNAFFVPSVGTFGINNTVIGPNSISTGSIQANAITTGLINAGAVTAAKINVANLAAIKADLGDITAGTITMIGAGSFIKTAVSGARIELDNVNGLRAYNSGGTLRTQLPISGSGIADIFATVIQGKSDSLILGDNTLAGQVNVSAATIDFQISSSIGATLGSGAFNIKNSFVFQVAGTTVVDASRNITGQTITANIGFSGSGASLTSLNAGNISSGTLAIGRGGTNNTSYTTNGMIFYNGTSLTTNSNFTFAGSDLTMTTSGNMIFSSSKGIRDNVSACAVALNTTVQIFSNNLTQTGEFGTTNIKLYISGVLRTILSFDDGLGHKVLYY